MNKLLMMTLSVTILTFIGCSKNDNSQDEKTTEATNSTPEIAGVDMRIWYKDGVSFGTTRATDVMVNGGYPTYDIGTGLQNGFIVMNGAVNDLGGVDLGICNNAIKADNKLNDECTLPINKNEPKPSPEPEEDKEDTTPQPSPEPEEDKEDTTPQPSPEPEEDKEDTTPQPSPEPEEDKEDTTPQPSPEPEEDKEDDDPADEFDDSGLGDSDSGENGEEEDGGTL